MSSKCIVCSLTFNLLAILSLEVLYPYFQIMWPKELIFDLTDFWKCLQISICDHMVDYQFQNSKIKNMVRVGRRFHHHLNFRELKLKLPCKKRELPNKGQFPMVYTNECKCTFTWNLLYKKKTKSFEWGVVRYPKLWHSNGWTHKVYTYLEDLPT
jgi:hypothetical protein